MGFQCHKLQPELTNLSPSPYATLCYDMNLQKVVTHCLLPPGCAAMLKKWEETSITFLIVFTHTLHIVVAKCLPSLIFSEYTLHLLLWILYLQLLNGSKRSSPMQVEQFLLGLFFFFWTSHTRALAVIFLGWCAGERLALIPMCLWRADRTAEPERNCVATNVLLLVKCSLRFLKNKNSTSLDWHCQMQEIHDYKGALLKKKFGLGTFLPLWQCLGSLGGWALRLVDLEQTGEFYPT